MRTSYAPGHPQVSWRDGYRVIRKAGRYMVFPRAAFSEMMGWHGASDALVEIWNGMPFFSPVWARAAARRVAAPRARHDVGDDAAAAARAARAHDRVPRRAAALPAHADRHAVGVVEATSSSQKLHFTAQRIDVVPPGIDPRFSPGGDAKSPTPLVVAVGRLVPVKRFDLLIDALADVKAPPSRSCSAVIVGEGYERDALEAQIARARRRRLDLASRPRRRRRARRPVPAGVGRRERVGARGLGHDDHRGRGVRHARGRDAHRRATTTPCVDGATGLLVDDGDGLRGRARPRARRRRVARAARRGARSSTRPRSRGARRARHARGARRRGAAPTHDVSRAERPTPSRSRRRRCRRGASPRSATSVLALLAYVPPLLHRAGQGRGRHEAVPVPRSRPAARARAVDVGSEHRHGHRHPPEHRLPVPDGPVLLGPRPARRARLGRAAALARLDLLFAAGVGVLYLLRTFGLRGPGVVVAALAYMFTPYIARLRGAHLGAAACRGPRCRG